MNTILLRNLIAAILLATPFLSSPLFAQASKPRVNNEKRTKPTGQVKRMHPHALKLIIQGKKEEAIAYLKATEAAKVNPKHTKLLLDIAQGATDLEGDGGQIIRPFTAEQGCL